MSNLFFHIEAEIKTEKELDHFVDYLESLECGLRFIGTWNNGKLIGIIKRPGDCNTVDWERVFIYFNNPINRIRCKISELTSKYMENPVWIIENDYFFI